MVSGHSRCRLDDILNQSYKTIVTTIVTIINLLLLSVMRTVKSAEWRGVMSCLPYRVSVSLPSTAAAAVVCAVPADADTAARRSPRGPPGQ